MRDTINLRGPNVVRPRVEVDSLIGVDVQGYVITRLISSGGVGVVYEANHLVIGRRAAVKVLRPEFAADEALAASFLREARAVSAIRHRNIVEVLNFGFLPGGRQYMMMEFLEGETLTDLMERLAPMDTSHVLQICEEILSGLAAAHHAGVVHRDLKPGNIMVCRDSNDDLTVKICDFGLARRFDPTADRPGVEPIVASREDRPSLLAGTPEYISPEQASGGRVDGQADLYCLGVILFEMLTGRLPFESESAVELLEMHRSAIPARLSAVAPGVPLELDTLIDLMLSKAPEDRPPGAKITREIVRALGEVELTQTGSSESAPAVRPAAASASSGPVAEPVAAPAVVTAMLAIAPSPTPTTPRMGRQLRARPAAVRAVLEWGAGFRKRRRGPEA